MSVSHEKLVKPAGPQTTQFLIFHERLSFDQAGLTSCHWPDDCSAPIHALIGNQYLQDDGRNEQHHESDDWEYRTKALHLADFSTTALIASTSKSVSHNNAAVRVTAYNTCKHTCRT